jgi:ferredoxin-like protein FixX
MPYNATGHAARRDHHCWRRPWKHSVIHENQLVIAKIHHKYQSGYIVPQTMHIRQYTQLHHLFTTCPANMFDFV